MKHKPAVGEVLYSLNIGNSARWRPQKLTPVVVIKVGRKYFTVSEEDHKDNLYMHTQYHIDTWREKNDYSADSELYVTKQEWLDKKESSEICARIRDTFEYGRNNKNLHIDYLRKIERIINGIY